MKTPTMIRVDATLGEMLACLADQVVTAEMYDKTYNILQVMIETRPNMTNRLEVIQLKDLPRNVARKIDEFLHNPEVKERLQNKIAKIDADLEKIKDLKMKHTDQGLDNLSIRLHWQKDMIEEVINEL